MTAKRRRRGGGGGGRRRRRRRRSRCGGKSPVGGAAKAAAIGEESEAAGSTAAAVEKKAEVGPGSGRVSHKLEGEAGRVGGSGSDRTSGFYWWGVGKEWCHLDLGTKDHVFTCFLLLFIFCVKNKKCSFLKKVKM